MIESLIVPSSEPERTVIELGASQSPALDSAQLAGALHEVSNALTVVVGWLEEAAKRGPDSSRGAIDIALDHARVGYRVARRAIGASVGVSDECPGIPAWLAGVALAIEPLAAARNVAIETRVGPSASGVQGVTLPDEARQVALNLLLNALSFSPPGGRIQLTAERQGLELVLVVSDDGPGIAPSRVAGLLDAPQSTRAGGAGLGLAHSAGLARRSGGALRVLRVEPSAVFELRWPLALPTQVISWTEAPGAADSEPPPAQRWPARALDEPTLASELPLTVLLLEDDEAVRGLIELTFEARGVRVKGAATLEDAIRALAAGPVDVALVDLSPIAADVPGALRSLREGAPRRPLVLITGSAVGMPAGTEDQFAAWVRKPFVAHELLETVRRVTTLP